MALSPPYRPLRVEHMGRVSYASMLALQEQRHREVLTGQAPDTLFLLEHEPVITLGRNSGSANVLVSRELLAARGVELFATGRGGDVTYHGPGQVVGYPILLLQEGERDIKGYVWRLEEIMIRAARDLGVTAERVEGLRGIWVAGAKLGAVGVRIAQWATLHGFAFNVAGRLEGFELIVPCGLAGRPVTSLERLLGRAPSLPQVEAALARHAADVLGRQAVTAEPTALPVTPTPTLPATTPAAAEEITQ